MAGEGVLVDLDEGSNSSTCYLDVPAEEEPGRAKRTTQSVHININNEASEKPIEKKTKKGGKKMCLVVIVISVIATITLFTVGMTAFPSGKDIKAKELVCYECASTKNLKKEELGLPYEANCRTSPKNFRKCNKGELSLTEHSLCAPVLLPRKKLVVPRHLSLLKALCAPATQTTVCQKPNCNTDITL